MSSLLVVVVFSTSSGSMLGFFHCTLFFIFYFKIL